MLKLKDRKNGDYELEIQGERLDLNSSDLIGLMNSIESGDAHYGVRYNMIIDDTPQNVYPKRGDYHIRIQDTQENKNMIFSLNNFEMDLLKEELSKVKDINPHLPFQLNQEVYTASIGFINEEKDWTYFDEPKKTKVTEVVMIDGISTFELKIMDEDDKFHTVSFEDGVQIDHLNLVINTSKERIFAEMINRVHLLKDRIKDDVREITLEQLDQFTDLSNTKVNVDISSYDIKIPESLTNLKPLEEVEESHRELSM
jgi:hypothetical protein